MQAQGKVTKVWNRNNSRNGNPIWEIELEGIGVFKTPTDAGWVYAHTWRNLVGKTVYLQAHRPRKNWIMHEMRVEG